jgi:hypothetical protein
LDSFSPGALIDPVPVSVCPKGLERFGQPRRDRGCLRTYPFTLFVCDRRGTERKCETGQKASKSQNADKGHNVPVHGSDLLDRVEQRYDSDWIAQGFGSSSTG